MVTTLLERLTSLSVTGIDLGSATLKVVQLDRVDGQTVLRGCVVADVSDQTAVIRTLTKFFSLAGRKLGEAAIALASPELIVKPVSFPAMPKRELAGAIRLEAEQAVLNGHTLDEVAMDWHPLTSESRQSIRGLLAVVPKSAVASRLQLAQSAGLKPVVVDVEGLALWNAYWALVGSRDAERRTSTVLLVNVGAATTNLVIAKGPDELLLVRDLRLGGQALGDGRQVDWFSEIRDSLAYARSKTGLRALDAVYVSGGFAAQAIDPLQSAMEAPITQWNPLEQLARDEHSPDVDLALGPLLAVAIGLALRQPS